MCHVSVSSNTLIFIHVRENIQIIDFVSTFKLNPELVQFLIYPVGGDKVG